MPDEKVTKITASRSLRTRINDERRSAGNFLQQRRKIKGAARRLAERTDSWTMRQRDFAAEKKAANRDGSLR